MDERKHAQGGPLKQPSGGNDYKLQEQGTERYVDLEMAQAAALPVVAQALAIAIRAQVRIGKFSAIIDAPGVEGRNAERVVDKQTVTE